MFALSTARRFQLLSPRPFACSSSRCFYSSDFFAIERPTAMAGALPPNPWTLLAGFCDAQSLRSLSQTDWSVGWATFSAVEEIRGKARAAYQHHYKTRAAFALTFQSAVVGCKDFSRLLFVRSLVQVAGAARPGTITRPSCYRDDHQDAHAATHAAISDGFA